MEPTEYNALTVDERQALLHRVYDEAIDKLVADDWDLPTPGQVSHVPFEGLHRCLQAAIREVAK